MSIGFIHSQLFLFNKPEPLRQSTLLMALATSLGDGQAVLVSLHALATDAKGEWKAKLQRLTYLLQDGSTLSDACLAVKGIVPERTQMAIRVAESAGALKQVLADEANQLMQQGQSDGGRPRLHSVFVNLLVIFLIAQLVIGFVVISIAPKLKDIFEGFGVPLPDATSQLLQISGWVIGFWPLLILPMFTFVVYALGFSAWANIKYLTKGQLPFVHFWPRFWTPDILKSLAVTVAAKKSIPDAIHALLAEMKPGKAATALSAVRQQAQAGTDLWQAMKVQGFLRTHETGLLTAAEAAGNLDWAIVQLATEIRGKRKRRLQTFATILQPVAILAVGVVIGFVVHALYMPIASLPLHELGAGI